LKSLALKFVSPVNVDNDVSRFQEETKMRSKILLVSFAIVAVILLAVTPALAQCGKIKDGTITDAVGAPITLGYDAFGYNYQAHMFNGTYDSSDRSLDGKYYGDEGDYADDSLIMKWSDDWLSNSDCNNNGKLDRGLNAKTGISTGTSMGWLINQVEGDYIGTDGDSHHYTYFAKIVYDNGAACTAGNPSCIWNLYSIIEEVYNDPFGGYHGVDRSRLARPAGLGFYK
jgi:hypothetical protein